MHNIFRSARCIGNSVAHRLSLSSSVACRPVTSLCRNGHRLRHSYCSRFSQASLLSTDAIPIVRYNDSGINDMDCISFGHYASISSVSDVVRPYSLVKHLGTPQATIAEGGNVWIRGRVAAVRQKGKSCFLVIRSDSFYTIQACHFVEKDHKDESKELLKFLSSLHLESIVDIYGSLQAASVKSCSQDNVEIIMKKVFVVSTAPPVLPFMLDDAARSNESIAASQDTARPFAAVSQVIIHCLFLALF